MEIIRGGIYPPPPAGRPESSRHKLRTRTAMDITRDIQDFLARRQAFEQRSRQTAAFRLATGIDLPTVLASKGEERANFIRRLGRIIERERLRGAKRHWSYDLNRHIALKQLLDELCGRPRRRTGVQKRRHRQTAAPLAPPSKDQSVKGINGTCACVPIPSSWQAASGHVHSSAPPSDSSNPGPISRDIDRA